MSFAATPAAAAWSHRDARSGFEVVYFQRLDTGHQIEGCTSAVEDGQTWFVDYGITLDEGWITRRAHVTSPTTTPHRHSSSPAAWSTTSPASSSATRESPAASSERMRSGWRHPRST